ncbi:MAG: hypothetical protein M0Z46_17960 [Actinomycetota bacterium]|jgi:rubrerythrin|nr:hypothetical protein [Actinomycetota bacterium]MDA8356520.1 hypothetical protein [Actinomycetota bacterium]
MDVDGAAREGGESSAEDYSSGFERALDGLRATGAGVTVRALVELLAEHGSEEGRMLAEYQRLSELVADPAARYLFRLILDDERRHHRMLVELATELAWGTYGGTETSVPPLGWHLDEDLAEATRALHAFEQEDRRKLEALRNRLRPFEESTLWGLMVQVMILDTEKHATILEFLERHRRRD